MARQRPSDGTGPRTTRVRIPTSANPGWRVLMAFDSDVVGSASSAAVVPVARRGR